MGDDRKQVMLNAINNHVYIVPNATDHVVFEIDGNDVVVRTDCKVYVPKNVSLCATAVQVGQSCGWGDVK